MKHRGIRDKRSHDTWHYAPLQGGLHAWPMGVFVPLSIIHNPMIAATHAAFTTGLYLGGSALFEYPAEPIGWGQPVFFSLVSDIDLPTSRIGQPLFWSATVRVVLPASPAYRLEVGGKAERVLLSVLALLTVVMRRSAKWPF